MINDVLDWFRTPPTGRATTASRTGCSSTPCSRWWRCCSRWRSACRWRSGSGTSAAGAPSRSTSPTWAGRSRSWRCSRCWRWASSAAPTSGRSGGPGLATLITLALFALPPIITNAYVAVSGVDEDLVEAARGMGMSETQVLRGVELPVAMPLIVSGVRLAVVQVWATATIAALVAGPGLGRIITHGYDSNHPAEVIAGSIIVAVVALILEGIMALLQRALDPLPAGAADCALQGLSGPCPRLAAEGSRPPDTRGAHRGTQKVGTTMNPIRRILVALVALPLLLAAAACGSDSFEGRQQRGSGDKVIDRRPEVHRGRHHDPALQGAPRQGGLRHEREEPRCARHLPRPAGEGRRADLRRLPLLADRGAEPQDQR